jgi:uncharacterized protein DUF4436
MKSRPKRLQIGLAILFVAFYLAVLSRNLSESQRRSLLMDQPPVAADQVRISIRVTAVNLGSSELTARIGFRLAGTIAKDPVTPAVDLKLFLNDIRGSQEIDFPRGRRMNSIQVTFSLDGNINRYPFDSYRTSLRMVVTKATNNVGSKMPTDKTSETTVPLAEADADVWVDTPKVGDSLPIVSSLAASLPGLKFDGNRVERPDNEMEGFNLVVRRADNVIVVSILTMVLMMTLAMSVIFMSVEALTSQERLDLLPLTLSITLLFGLPALRNSQPAVPPLGAFGDYLSFLWAEQIVAVAAVVMIWTWLVRGRRAGP